MATKKISKEEAQRRAEAEAKKINYSDPLLPLPGKKPASTKKPAKRNK